MMNRRIWHEDFLCWWDRQRVQRAFDNCAVVWVSKGETIRKATLAEQIELRAEQAKGKPAPDFPTKESRGLRFVPAISGLNATRSEGPLAYEATLAATGRLCWLTQRPTELAA